jgi:hypothetical protein
MNHLETHVLRLIAEDIDSPDVFVDTAEGLEPIRDSINDAVQELCMVMGHYRRRYLLALHEERAIYRLAPQADEMGWVINVWDRDSHRHVTQTDLLNLANDDPRFLYRSGTSPDYWYQLGWEYLGVFPRPAAKGKILELDMIAVPKRYSHGQTPIRLKEVWQQAAVQRSVSEFYAGRGDANRATEWFGRYLETAGIMAIHPDQAERLYQMGAYRRWGWADRGER